MAKKPQITYLLGAGASAFAVPTIKYFSFLLEKFRNDIVNLIIPNKDNHSDETINSILIKLNFINELSSFATIDTWARKLFLSDDPRYNDIKDLISLFLIYIQLGSIEPIGQILNDQKRLDQFGLSTLNDFEKNQIDLMYQRPLDPRYDLFLGSILKHDKTNRKLSFPENINIVSWNYDSQFETSFRTFSNSQILKENNNPVEILKLNGSANFTFRFSDYEKLRSFNFSDSIESNKGFVNEIIKLLSNQYTYLNTYNHLKFAWEMENDTINKAQSIINDTEILVVIGYTFPYFNQEVERLIFNSPNKIRTIYYQIPESEYSGMLERLKGTLYKGKDEPKYNKNADNSEQVPKLVKFVNINDLTQFYIPNEFYI